MHQHLGMNGVRAHQPICWLAMLAILTLGACAVRYSYAPRAGSTAKMPDSVTAEYPIPPTLPRGVLRVASVGVVAQPAERRHALQVTFVILNEGDRMWRFDTREQRLELGLHPRTTPLFGSVGDGAPAVVEIPPGSEQVVDLLFPLPSQIQQDTDLPTFGVVWMLDAAGDVVVRRTVFDRRSRTLNLEDW